MEIRKVKCWIMEVGLDYYLLISDEKPSYLDLMVNTFTKNIIRFTGTEDLSVNCRIHAASTNGRKLNDCLAFLPEYVVEKYKKGINKFEIKMQTKEVPVFGYDGLLQVTNIIRKQHFTRQDVMRILDGAVSDPQEWLEKFEISS